MGKKKTSALSKRTMACCGTPCLTCAPFPQLYPHPRYGGFFTGYNGCNGLYGGWNGGGYANWNLYGSPCFGFRGCLNQCVGLGGDGSGIGF